MTIPWLKSKSRLIMNPHLYKTSRCAAVKSERETCVSSHTRLCAGTAWKQLGKVFKGPKCPSAPRLIGQNGPPAYLSVEGQENCLTGETEKLKTQSGFKVQMRTSSKRILNQTICLITSVVVTRCGGARFVEFPTKHKVLGFPCQIV